MQNQSNSKTAASTPMPAMRRALSLIASRPVLKAETQACVYAAETAAPAEPLTSACRKKQGIIAL